MQWGQACGHKSNRQSCWGILIRRVLVLGGAILHSRETAVKSAVQPATRSRAASVQPAKSVQEPSARAVPPEETAGKTEEPPPPLPAPAEPVAAPPYVQRKAAVPVTIRKHAVPATQIAELRTGPPFPAQTPGPARQRILSCSSSNAASSATEHGSGCDLEHDAARSCDASSACRTNSIDLTSDDFTFDDPAVSTSSPAYRRPRRTSRMS